MRLTKKQRFYQDHIKTAEESGIPLAAYAKQQGLTVQSLYGEKYRVSKKQGKSSTGFVRVQDVTEPVLSSTLLQIRLPNGVTLALPSRQVSIGEMLQNLAKL